MIRRIARCAALASLAACAHAPAPPPAAIAADLAARTPSAAWPPGYPPDRADLFAHNELLVQAPCEIVWGHLVDAGRWPTWYDNAHDVHLRGDATLQPSTTFTWRTFGLAVESTIDEHQPAARLAWFGRAPGLAAYHRWELARRPDGCAVVTEEVANGPVAADLRAHQPAAMHDGHARWLAQLKAVSEAR